MDNTKEFILQCEKAVEIQKQWELESGDFFTRNLTDMVYTLDQGELDNINGIGRDRCSKMPYSTWISSKIWLPRQDQLQEMLRSKYDIRTMCWDFNGFIGGRRVGYSIIFNSMEQLWLAFVMQVKFGKVWNGKEWEIVND